jgi:hypothetical protein
MGWETRKGRPYYYHKTRIGGRVVSQYIGRGPLAEALIAFDAADRADRAWKGHTQAEARQRDQEREQRLEALRAVLRDMTDAALLASGYHTHKGQWRKRREQPRDQSLD